MSTTDPTNAPYRLRRSRHVALAFAAYCLLAAAYTHPLLAQARTRIASDPFDPILNTTILWWNATVVPFTAAWWTPPFFYPSQNIAAFTENLAGMAVVSSPLFWITGNPILTYNLSLFLTWPLSAIAAYLLAWRLLRRHDAAFIAGLAFGFAPYRMTQISHIQVLAIYWLPLALLGLHGYLGDRRRRWLMLFGAAWVLQSLSNSYFMLFGAVVIALWILYFCSTRAHWQAGLPIAGAWLAASALLAPIMWKYRGVHEYYGLTRGLSETVEYSAQAWSWLRVDAANWFWSETLGTVGVESNLFPGVTVVAVVALAIGVFLIRPATVPRPGCARQVARLSLGAIALASVVAAIVTLLIGPWRVEVLGLGIRMSGIRRAATLTIVAGSAFVYLTPVIWRRLRDRSVFAFYTAATVATAVLACGPEIRRGSDVLLDPAPYRWLMMFVPGFTGMRVPARFWMIGALCLAVAAAAAFAWLVPRRGLMRPAAATVVCAGLLLDAWPSSLRMAQAPERWPAVEAADVPRALLELPLGPNWDAAAAFRSLGHRRRVVNGVSGYDPLHYLPLRMGLAAHDPSVLRALASFGPLDVIVDGSQDPSGRLARYVEAIAGVALIRQDGPRTLYRMPDVAPPLLGAPLLVAAVDRWGQGLSVDLASVKTVGGIGLSIGRTLPDLSQPLVVAVSTDAVAWRTVWDGSILGGVVRGAALDPSDIRIHVPFDPVPARFIRLNHAGRFDAGLGADAVQVFSPLSAAAIERATRNPPAPVPPKLSPTASTRPDRSSSARSSSAGMPDTSTSKSFGARPSRASRTGPPTTKARPPRARTATATARSVSCGDTGASVGRSGTYPSDF